MWRAFGSGPHVALIFNIPVNPQGSLALNIMFSPVCYLPPAGVHESLLQAAANISRERAFLTSLSDEMVINYVAAILLAAVTCLKHQGFHEEREWRAIYLPTLNPSPFMQSALEVISGVPQLLYKIPLDPSVNSVLADLDLSRLLTRIIVGPTEHGPSIGAAFTAELAQLGVPDAGKRVALSEIPIRS